MSATVLLGLSSLAHLPTPSLAQSPAPSGDKLEFKGDSLGLPIAEFKARHRRAASGKDVAPFCSDEHPEGAFVSGAKEVPGEVWCLLEFPYELIKPGYSLPTFADVALASPLSAHGFPSLLYRFIDVAGVSVLWSIQSVLPHSGYPQVKAAMLSEFGSPASVQTEYLQNLFGTKLDGEIVAWEAASWRVALIERFGFQDVSGVVYVQKAAEGVYTARKSELAAKAAADM